MTGEQDALSGIVTREQLEILQRSLAELPDQMRQCVRLRIKDELKYKEIDQRQLELRGALPRLICYRGWAVASPRLLPREDYAPPALWKLAGYGKLRLPHAHPPDLPTPVGNPTSAHHTLGIPTATHNDGDDVICTPRSGATASPGPGSIRW
jgi:hypothetical protein